MQAQNDSTSRETAWREAAERRRLQMRNLFAAAFKKTWAWSHHNSLDKRLP